jgi:hypothetical protein
VIGTGLVVPRLEGKPWPTLGPQVCDWIEQHLVFGPGDLLGRPAQLDAEKRALIYRMYEVYPKGGKHAGRRRFKRVAISLRKGSAKTELAAWIAAAELHPDAPVRTVGWDKKGHPLGGGVTDPYIPMVAYTEEQSEELAYGALRVILENSEVAADFDIGLERIMRVDGHGKAEPLASAPHARDGARTTFQHFDETWHMTLPRLKKAHRAMLANIPKRRLADAWSLETTTAPAPGEDSVAEDTMRYASAIAEGKLSDTRLFFFHRQASEAHKLDTLRSIRTAVKEASGPVTAWSDIDGIVEQWKDPTADRNYLRQVWLNQPVRSSERAFDVVKWATLARPGYRPPPGALIALGFDGSKFQDATALVGAEVETGILFRLGIWQRPELAGPEFEIPTNEVNDCLEEAFATWSVFRLYADPPYWEDLVASWAGKHGEQVVVRWYTTRTRKMADAVRSFVSAIADGSLKHDGDPALSRHVANACKRRLQVRDEQGVPLWTIQKERPDSPLKIDAAMASILAWEARRDAITVGATPTGPSVWDQRVATGEEVLPWV